MQVHRELSVYGPPDRIDAFGEDIRRSLADGWERDTDAEEHMRSFATAGRKVFCFASPPRPRRPAATIFLLYQESGRLYVANIVPHDVGELRREQYNSILEDFFRRYAEPAAARNGVRAELTEPVADLERWLPPTAAEKLRLFCAVANRRTGSSHPADRDRWYDFIIAAHDAEADFTASTLERWLHEEGGWDEEMSDRLAIEYEFARGLLAHAHAERVGG